MKKRKRCRSPKVKRMKRPARLVSARTWLKSYKGKHVLKGYRKRYGTDRVTAAIELQMLGYSISDERIAEIKREVAAAAAAKQRARQAKADAAAFYACQDETFAYIAGYTGWGFPYGVTWEEMEEIDARQAAEDL